ncbi:lipopolysaccharide biosynthesis protein [Maribacter algicola]|uniref:Lipopolysaccharide biosynthesis protein n=1 Tax=Meishania litoralis TaxID=3434685 RepID=A0ACC7LHL4_9FLAO
MNPLKKLFKQTAIYGLATVLPRMISFFLVRVHTEAMAPGVYGELAVIFAWFAMFNVVLAYGMETAFFRFYSNSDDKDRVVSTSLISILVSTFIFMGLALLFQDGMADLLSIDPKYIKYVVFILALDALVIIPFAWLRANERPTRYAAIKILNVIINFGLNVFFLFILPKMSAGNPDSFFGRLYVPGFQISYILIANLIASAFTLLLVFRPYVRSSYGFDTTLWKKMMKYALPVLVAGIAYSINEVFDRVMLEEMLPASIAKTEVGMYNACVKLALFMTLFSTAFRLGIEPFFFNHAGSENPQRAYAQITNYFVILGSIILLAVVVFADVLKELFVPDEAYWDAMKVVPIVVLASFFLGIYHNLSVWYKVTDRTRYGAFISVIGALITIGINFFFIPLIGYMASALATLMAYGSMMVISYYLGKSRYPVPYNFRKIIFYLSLSILFSALSFYVFDRNLIIGIVLLLLFFGLVYRLENEMLKRIFLKR